MEKLPIDYSLVPIQQAFQAEIPKAALYLRPFDATLDGFDDMLTKNFNAIREITPSGNPDQKFKVKFTFVNPKISMGSTMRGTARAMHTAADCVATGETFTFRLTSDIDIDIYKVYDAKDAELVKRLADQAAAILESGGREVVDDLSRAKYVGRVSLRNNPDTNTVALDTQLPNMVGSKLSPAHVMSAFQAYLNDDDHTNEGCYFVVGGKDKTVAATFSAAYNTPVLVHNDHKNEDVRCNVLSMHGVRLENSAQLVLAITRPRNRARNTDVERSDQSAVHYDLVARINSSGTRVAIGMRKGSEVPIIALFNAFGYFRCEDIFRFVFPDGDTTRTKTNEGILRLGEILNYGDSHRKYRDEKGTSTEDDAIYYIGKCVLSDEGIADKMEEAKSMADAYFAKNDRTEHSQPEVLELFERALIVARTKNFLYEHFLPHLNPYGAEDQGARTNVSSETRRVKCHYLGYLINMMLRSHARELADTDRDAAYGQRIHPSGYRYAMQFKLSFNAKFFTVREGFDEVLRNVANLDDLELVRRAVVDPMAKVNKNIAADMESNLRKNQPVEVGKSEPRMIAENFDRKSIVHMNSRFDSRNKRASVADRQPERSLIVRQYHPSQCFFLDPFHTPENRDTVGRQQHGTTMLVITSGIDAGAMNRAKLADIARIQAPTPQDEARVEAERVQLRAALVPLRDIRDIVRDDMMQDPEWHGKYLFAVEEVPLSEYGKYYGIHLNGTLIAYAERTNLGYLKITDHIRDKIRRDPQIHSQTSVSIDRANARVELFTDAGRDMFPALIVNEQTGDIDYRPEMLMRDGKFKPWDEILKMGVIEYIDSAYARNCQMAQSLEGLRQASGRVPRRYTHVPIPCSFLDGTMSIIPFVNHNKGQKAALSCAYMTQAMGVPVLNPHNVGTKFVDIQHRVEKPLCGTFMFDALKYIHHPFGLNTIVATMSYGSNQEDSIVLNAGAVSLGRFAISRYKTISHRADSNSKQKYFYPDDPSTIIRPVVDPARARVLINPKNGLPKAIGLTLNRGDPIISVMKEVDEDPAKAGSGKKWVDQSIVHADEDDHDEMTKTLATIDHFCEQGSGTGNASRVVHYHIDRTPVPGDKFASSTAQKGVLGKAIPRHLLPFTADGMCVDLIFNVHGLMKRETFNAFLITVMSQIASAFGTFVDCSPFIEQYTPENMGKLLEDLGYAADGKRVMYDGRTGERFDARIFCGAPDYHRLSHMVDDKMFARSVDGPKDPVKRQPVKGRAKGGGIQMGEMEMKTFQSVGSAEVIQELKANCDECDIYVCKTCNSIAYPSSAPNAEASRREIVCPVCKDAGSQQTVLTNVRWAPILVKHVHESAGIRMDMIPAPPSIYREAADAASELPTVAEDETDGEDEETTEDDEEEAEDDEGSDAKKEAE